ncbi:MAG: glycosyltransferase family 4 protein [Gammaproteobacteria bacterium]|nr:glycosyltransferase family 4 protein [Gammaproteobacteria bacterium]
MKNITVAAFTQGMNVPSARFRVRQLIDPLVDHSVTLTEFVSQYSAYPPQQTWRRPQWMLNELVGRIPQLIASHKYDVSIIQREFISTIPSLEFLSKRPRIFDVDDAVWLYRGGIAADTIARASDRIVCGNSFLADYFSQFGKKIDIIPTAVDIARFNRKEKNGKSRLILGWSGSSSGYRFFDGLEKPMAKLLERYPDWVLRIVSNSPPVFNDIPASKVEYIQWTPANEAQTIAEMDIGLMPLDNSFWSRGKCSYKMLLYMACGVPVVVSDVGMNAEIIRQADVGFGVSNPDEWMTALEALMDSEGTRRLLGSNGRQLVEQYYSLDAIANVWSNTLCDTIGLL